MAKIERNPISTGSRTEQPIDLQLSKEMVWSEVAGQFLTEDQASWFATESQSVIEALNITPDQLKQMLTARPVNRVIFDTPDQYPTIDSPSLIDMESVKRQFPILAQGGNFRELMRFTEACEKKKITFLNINRH